MLQSYKYGVLTIIRNKQNLFWMALFPLLLGTFFHLAFGGVMEGGNFNQIPVAIVEVEDNSQLSVPFKEMVAQLAEGDEALLTPQYLTLEDAKQKLAGGDITGIFEIGEEISLIVAGVGINQSILKTISNQFLQMSRTLGNVAATQPDMLEQAIESIYSDIQVNQEITLGRGEVHLVTYYFYALLAMVCFMGADIGFLKAVNIQADASALAARRSISPTKKWMLIIGDFLAGVTAQFLLTLISMLYFVFILNVNFGEQLGMIILTNFVGCLAGVSFGALFATVMKGSIEARQGILSAVNMVLYVLGGLMSVEIRMVIRNNAPLLDRINPIAMMGDAFYSLAVFDNYDRFFSLIGSLLIFTLVCCIVSATFLRRKRYASI